MVKYSFKKSIFAVGQGGFSMGVLYGKDKRKPIYSYIYDCGSIQVSSLESEIVTAIERLPTDEENINTVFISHLDADHINGFDKVCEHVDRRIEKVVIPYLDIISKYYEVAHSLNTNNCTGLFFSFLENPITWIKNRIPNVEIIQLNPYSNDTQDDESDQPDLPKRNTNDNDNDNDNPQELRLEEIFSKERIGIDKKQNAYRWYAQVPATSNKTSAPILLLAYIPPQNEKKLSNFKSALKSYGFDKLNMKELSIILRDKEKRKKLRECYLEFGSDHNIISMNLLVKSISTPSCTYEMKIRPRLISHRYDLFHEGRDFGYLFTGDSKLKTKIHFSRWEKFFQNHFNDVNFFFLPHHGSALNFNSKMIDLMPNAVFIAQAQATSSVSDQKHPSPSVIKEIEQGAGRIFHHIDDNKSNRLEFVYYWK
ncbi:TPA: hypothetical protein ACKP0P_000331 [Serratia marcescens]